jgi:hypothetical protein
MKILDVPQTGKLGLTVTFPSRNALIRRTLVTPANPNTAAQLRVRSAFTQQAHRYDTLTQAQQDAWVAAAGQYQSRASLGQSGPLTGLQLFVKINSLLAQLGQDVVDAPPALPLFGNVAPQNLVITNTGGAIAVKLTCPTSPGQNTLLRSAAPQHSGVRRAPSMVILGMCPTPAQSSADITSLYVAKFGVAPVGSRLFVQANLVTDGWQGPKAQFSAVVPASA